MQKRFLEDIVEEDLKQSNSLSRRLGNKIRDSLDSWISRHPVLSSGITYAAIEYLRRKYFPNAPELIPVISAYSFYLITSTVKEYLLEGRKVQPTTRGISSWISHNPKLVAILAAIAGAYISHQGEAEILREVYKHYTSLELRIGLADKTVVGGIASGIIAEASIRGLSNLRRIKRSIKRIKTNLAERIWNFVFEHPFLISGATTIAMFSMIYSSPYTTREYGRRTPLTGNLLEDVVEHPGKIIHMGLLAGLVGTAALVTTLTAGSLLHTHSIREGYYRLAKTINLALRNKKRAIEYQKRLTALPNNPEITVEDLVDLGNMYYQSNDREQAFKCYRRALRLLSKRSDEVSYADFFRRKLRASRLRRAAIRLTYSIENTEESAVNRMFMGLLNKDLGALEDIKKLVEQEPNNPRLVYIYGKALEILGYKESGRRQKERAVRIVLNSGFDLSELTGSKNKVVLFEDELLREEVIAKSASPTNLAREITAIEQTRKIISDFDKYDVPIPIAAFEHEGRTYYVMEQASGELLADRIRSGKATTEEFYEVAQFMGLIHAKLEPGKIEERNHIETIRSRLTEAQVSEITVERVCGHLYPAVNSLIGIARVCNRDGHPRNWIVDEFGGIIAIDLEADRVVPLTFDTANLLDQYLALDEGEKDKVLVEHLEAFTHYSKDKPAIEMKDYRLAYLNSVVLRALEIYSQVRTTNREVMHASLTNAQRAIERIKRDFKTYYNAHGIAYRELDRAVEQLKVI